MKKLTKITAKTAKTIRSIDNPEWGIKVFNYNAQPLSDGTFCSTWGIGCNGALLFESEYKYWEVIS